MSSRVLDHSIARSLALHLALFLVALYCATHMPKPVFQSQPVEITLSEPEIEKSKTENRYQKSIVQASKGEEVAKAKPNAYLSDKSRSVKEETSARNAGEALTAVPAQTRSQRSNPVEKPRKLELTDFGIKITPKASPNYNQERNWAKPQTGELLSGGQYIQGMKAGEVSALNTKEFVFYSYFERVRRQLDQAWQPIVRENIQKIFKTGRRLASNSDYTTRALVTLDQKGQIAKVQILEESGTHDLDQAAVDALNQAGPYPNPPKGLVDSNGTVQIRWDFILKT